MIIVKKLAEISLKTNIKMYYVQKIILNYRYIFWLSSCFAQKKTIQHSLEYFFLLAVVLFMAFEAFFFCIYFVSLTMVNYTVKVHLIIYCFFPLLSTPTIWELLEEHLTQLHDLEF